MKLAALKGGIRDLKIVVPEEDGTTAPESPDNTVNIQYKPGEITLEVAETMREAVASGVEERTMLIFLSKILVSWDIEVDVEDEEGNPTGEVQPLPCNEAGIKKLPAPFLAYMMYCVGEDARPKAQTETISSAPSAPGASADESQNGTTSFGLPATTESHPGSS